jgi:hypothetical protein
VRLAHAQEELAQMRQELPAFKQFLLTTVPRRRAEVGNRRHRGHSPTSCQPGKTENPFSLTAQR